MTPLPNSLIRRLHRQESGAVMLMLLAAFLILFMLALALFDAGAAARDKMQSQVAADTSAFAHSTVKARGMNMVVYGNIIKRMFYAYMHTYAAGWSALLGAFAVDDALCVRLKLSACKRAAKELGVIAAEIAESPSNIAALVSPDGRSQREIAALDATQAYIIAVTPWWAWVENFTRANQNGAFATMSWPPPSSRVTGVKDFINRGAGAAEKVLGTDLLRAIPPNTYATDQLPVVRRDRDRLLDAWKVKLDAGKFLSHVSYCDQYLFSYEALTLQAQYLVESADIWTMKLGFVTQVMSPGLACLAAGVVYGGDVLDYKIAGGHFGKAERNAIGGALAGNNDEVSDDWLTRTSSLTIAYKPSPGRMSDASKSGRGKFTIVGQDYHGARPTSSGTWAIARSELTYVPRGLGAGLSDVLSGIPGPLGKLVDTTVRTPDMWTPAWTSRLRPAVLPGEQIATTTAGDPLGLDAMFWDSVAYFIMASALMGAVEEGLGNDAPLDDIVDDLYFLADATRGFGPDQLEGITK